MFARVKAPVDVANTMPAGARHSIEVTGYHERGIDIPVTEMTNQVSFENGTTWHPATSKPAGGGTWTVTFKVPPLAQTDGFVTLRTVARDSEGNSVDQVLNHTYQLR